LNNPGYHLSSNALYIAIPVKRRQQTDFSYPAGQCLISARNNAINNKHLSASDCTIIQYDQHIIARL